MVKQGRPNVGLALSGGLARAVAHIGVLEVLTENHIPIDYLTANSSGTIAAAAYACGTLDKLKQKLFAMHRRDFLRVFARVGGESSILVLEKVEEFVREFTLEKKFEDIRPLMSFVSCDLDTGEAVSLNLGDIARAVSISCAVPGFFSPVRWGNRLLVDGGLYSLVPVEEARQMGADIVIGVNIAATKHVYKARYLYLYRGYSLLKKLLLADRVKKILKTSSRVLAGYFDAPEEGEKDNQPMDLIEVVTKSMEIAIRRRRENREVGADILLEPPVKHLGKLEFDELNNIYQTGRRSALQALPEIKRLIHEFDSAQELGEGLKLPVSREQR